MLITKDIEDGSIVLCKKNADGLVICGSCATYSTSTLKKGQSVDIMGEERVNKQCRGRAKMYCLLLFRSGGKSAFWVKLGKKKKTV